MNKNEITLYEILKNTLVIYTNASEIFYSEECDDEAKALQLENMLRNIEGCIGAITSKTLNQLEEEKHLWT